MLAEYIKNFQIIAYVEFSKDFEYNYLAHAFQRPTHHCPETKLSIICFYVNRGEILGTFSNSFQGLITLEAVLLSTSPPPSLLGLARESASNRASLYPLAHFRSPLKKVDCNPPNWYVMELHSSDLQS